MSKPLMCHVVAGYPTTKDCLRLMLSMQALGVAAIEVQIPFSDPIADGKTIMAANDVALAGGMTTASSLQLVKTARQQGVTTDIYVMSYLQKIRHMGLEQFCEAAANCEVQGLIVPDLPYDSPEFQQLREQAQANKLRLVPVLSPGMDAERLGDILALKPATIYLTSSQGITGNDYAPAEQLKQLVTTIKKTSEAEIMIGFGISTPADAVEVLTMGDVAVVGSAVIKHIQQGGVEAGLSYLKSLAAGL